MNTVQQQRADESGQNEGTDQLQLVASGSASPSFISAFEMWQRNRSQNQSEAEALEVYKH